jgi:general secretion pathway protein G
MSQKKTSSGNPEKSTEWTTIVVLAAFAIVLLMLFLPIDCWDGRLEPGKTDKTLFQIKGISGALELYKIDNGFYPTTEQGLKSLVEKPDSKPKPKKWKKYLDIIPMDPWGNDYVYIQPGTHKDFDLYSWGPDGVEGNEDDITSWVKKEEEKK